MKSIVFSFKKSAGTRSRFAVSTPDFRYLVKRYAVKSAFVLFLLGGLATGAVYACGADTAVLDSLDFLFTTNLDARLAQGIAETFCACFASDFIFLFALFLFGLAPWGIPFMFFSVFFKGFGTGITAGWLCVSYSVTGVGFYMLVMLPGTFLFCMALIALASHSFEFSRRMCSAMIAKSSLNMPSRSELIGLCSRFMSCLIMIFCAALVDTVLWAFLSGTFNF